MLKHIVMMNLKEMDSDEKQGAQNKLVNMLNELPNHISSIEAFEVGENFSSRPTAMDIVLTSVFKDEAGLDEYRIHPKHVEVLAYIKEIVAEARVVDYNVN